MLIAAAIFAVYVVLGILYERFIHPVAILMSLPPASVGALLCLQMFGFDLSLIAIIGLIMLIGVVKKERDHDDRLRARTGPARGTSTNRPKRRFMRRRCCASGRS